MLGAGACNHRCEDSLLPTSAAFSLVRPGLIWLAGVVSILCRCTVWALWRTFPWIRCRNPRWRLHVQGCVAPLSVLTAADLDARSVT